MHFKTEKGVIRKMTLTRWLKKSPGEIAFDVFLYSVLGFFLLIVAYPLYFIVIASFSDPNLVNLGKVVFWIKDLTLEGYNVIFKDEELWMTYANTILYTVVGTTISVFVTMAIAYPLSREQFSGKKFLMLFLLITMYFSGGMIPKYIQISNLGLRNTRFLMIILGCVTTYNIIVAKTTIAATIPTELESAAKIDGCNQLQFFGKIVLPLSKAIMSVLCLYYGVGKWNDYMNALIYLDDDTKYPLAMKLREILVTSSSAVNYDIGNAEQIEEQIRIALSVRYGVIIVSTIPVLCLYPYLQKYFVKGAMIGSVKE